MGAEDRPHGPAGSDGAEPAAPVARVPRRWREWPALPFLDYLARIPVARRRAILRPAAPLRLPRFRGALWHSVLGAAVKTLACAEASGVCPPCRRPATCPYAALFDSRVRHDGEAPLAPGSRVPGALVLDAGPWRAATVEPGTEVALDYTLVGRPDLAGVVDQAIELAGCAGLGRTRARAALARVEDRPGSPAAAAEAALAAAAGTVVLVLRTPLRLKAAGRYLRAFDPSVLVRDVTFRVTLLGHHHAGLPWSAPWPVAAAEARAARVTERRTRWVEGIRYSARQGRAIVLGGLVGTVTLEAVGPALAQVLGAATVLHGGKGAAVGLGELGVGGGEG
jgi:hypothetical protein